MLTYKGYTAHLRVDVEAQLLFGTVLDIKDTITFEGETIQEITQEFYRSVDAYLALCKELGEEPDRTFSGRLPLRTTPDNHHLIYLAAAQAEKSINAWMEEVIIEAAQKATRSAYNQPTVLPLEEYEQEQLLTRLEEKLNQLQAALKPYLKSNTPEVVEPCLAVLEPFLTDPELAKLIKESQKLAYSK
ncbi:type II toxin-antitoxin system HicB family antitoxin [Phormidium tenue FACHB-886]|nr:type II toxin-antitoxin system HicB family antitoxin [Phormidium tenue FACHB-886]